MKFLTPFLRLTLVCLLAGLAGCSTGIKEQPLDAQGINQSAAAQKKQQAWQQQQNQLKTIQQWNISGRLSVQTSDNGGQADFSWQQQNSGDYQIRIQAPLGAGTTWIKREAGLVEVTNTNGQQASDTNVDRLLYELTGWPLPVRGLYFWVRGLPSAKSDYQITQWHANGLPKIIEQDGWRIEFKSHRKIGQQQLPGKLFIKRIPQPYQAGEEEQEVDVRLIIRQWGLESGSQGV